MELDTIYNMDCLEGMKRIQDNFVDAVITSPPYNFCLRVRGEEYTKRSRNEEFGHTGMAMNKYTNGLTDDLDMDEYFKWQCACIDEMLRLSKGVVFYNIQLITGNKVAVFQILGKYADRIREVLVWDKMTAEPAMHYGVLNSEYELVLVFDSGDCKGRQFRQANWERGTLSNVIRIGKNRENDHRAAFPLQLPRTLIHNFTAEGATILDPFMGSGTTAIACIKERRHFIGFELSKEYYDKAVRRIKAEQAQLTFDF
jgi:DNA modification methylase